jgi:hypothetical protein
LSIGDCTLLDDVVVTTTALAFLFPMGRPTDATEEGSYLMLSLPPFLLCVLRKSFRFLQV